MITSKDNEKLKLVRRLRQRRRRDREGLFVTEGEDLLAAGLAAGVEPEVLLTLHGEGLGGEEVSAEALASASSLGSGTRAIAVWRQAWSPVDGPVCVYLHGVADPGNLGGIVRTANALVRGAVLLGPGCADPFGPKAVRATMGSIFTQPLAKVGIEDTPRPRVALVAHGGRPIEEWAPYRTYGPERRPTAKAMQSERDASSTEPQLALTLILGAERGGIPPEVLESADDRITIPLREGAAESLNVAAAAAVALQRISSEAARA
jgi:TrmH family RNA methyltransferase